MWKDPTVQEVRKVREVNEKKFNYNVKNIVSKFYVLQTVHLVMAQKK